ncbi:GTPase CgtA [Porphyromonas gingivicanis]|uniref:GTPase Obg n=1 Tax=Porphyromonas gingivicanis TaxID=266762 RepID=A0A0A2G546_9PORP|nr:GTPase ObgE [Porphyromonas gingivicanis]KGN97485.1 GTPase CgtA [Porphyromonas gingivicanis]
MAETNFVDYVKIYCRSGKGGRGSAHFRREKYIPKGGPDGGDGGNGGSIYIKANRNYWTLLHLRFNRHIYAPSGEAGSGALKTGTSGDDVIIEVPIGTSVYDAQTGEFILDVTQHEEKRLLLAGGRGGKGNTFFKSATNQAPRFAQPGEPAQEREIILQLKTLADVGLVGLPNAGKSTLLSAITSAKPKIADYPFTTLVPNLGIVGYRDNRSFVMADIPGIIEGASEGRGLGLRFLRHIERNSILLFMIPIDTDHIYKEYQVLLNELLKYNPGLGDKRRILAITKIDLADEELIKLVEEELPDDLPHIFISAVAQKGITELKDLLWEELNREMPYDNTELVRQAMTVETLHDDDTLFSKELPEEEDDEDELLEIEWDEDIQEDIGL